jgi:N-acyl-D-aspartate/D-glutamate deacylase
MEGVEDNPGSALHQGIEWAWESLAEYLDALDAMPRVMDIAAQVPHAAVRAYVLGERAHEEATTDEIAEMADIVEAALRAGAVGFTTSRTILHRSKHGLIPGTDVTPDELLAIGDAMAGVGPRVFEIVSDHQGRDAEREWLVDLARRSGCTVTYALAQTPFAPEAYRASLAEAERHAGEGLRIVPQVSSRPTGMLFGLQSSLHPFITHPTYRALSNLPLPERVARLREPEVREALLAEKPATENVIAISLMTRWAQIFPLGDPPDYEPAPATSVASVAAREGRSPEAVMLDWMLERDCFG